MAAIYVTLLVVFFSLRSTLESIALEPQTWAAPFTIAAACFLTTLFLLTFGATSFRTMLFCILIALMLGGWGSVLEAWAGHKLDSGVDQLHESGNPPTQLLAALVGAIILFLGIVPFEELTKLAPVLLLCRIRRITNMRSAMICGALAGMTFGLIESNYFAVTEFGPKHFGAGEWLVRYFGMSLTHGIWDALGGALAFRFMRNGKTAIRMPFLIVSVVHFAHNLLQIVIGPGMQILSMLVVLLPVYALGKQAWREESPLAH